MENINFNIGIVIAAIKSKERIKDWKAWLNRPMWSSNQAVCLFHGYEPGSLCRDDIEKLLILHGIAANEFRTPHQWKSVALNEQIAVLKPIISISKPSIDFSKILDSETLKFDELWLISHEIEPTKIETPINNAAWLEDNYEYIMQSNAFNDWIRTGKLSAKAVSTEEGAREYQGITPVDFFILAKTNNWFLPEAIHSWLDIQKKTMRYLERRYSTT